MASVSSTNTEASSGPFTGSGVTNWFPVAPNRFVQSYGGVVAGVVHDVAVELEHAGVMDGLRAIRSTADLSEPRL